MHKGKKLILDEIILRTKDDLQRRKKEYPEEWLGRSLSFNPYMPRDVRSALTSSSDDPIKIIAEVKKASPSKGVIKEEFDPLLIAKEYERGGADLISVLTEPHYFKGDIEYITQIRRYTPVPLLRKDFVVDRYQILEALVYGADTLLLIAKALETKELKELIEYSRHLGLEPLVEIHDKDDLKKSIFAGADIIGINHRDLKTFKMDMNLCSELIPLIPKGKIIVAESGIDSEDIVRELHKMGVDAFLIGEHFMKSDDIKKICESFKSSI